MVMTTMIIYPSFFKQGVKFCRRVIVPLLFLSLCSLLPIVNTFKNVTLECKNSSIDHTIVTVMANTAPN